MGSVRVPCPVPLSFAEGGIGVDLQRAGLNPDACLLASGELAGWLLPFRGRSPMISTCLIRHSTQCACLAARRPSAKKAATSVAAILLRRDDIGVLRTRRPPNVVAHLSLSGIWSFPESPW